MGKIIDDSVEFEKLITDKRGKQTFNIPCAFDIETTSFYRSDGAKAATMYIWQFCFNGYVFAGRTWETFREFMDALTRELALDENRYLIIYVHNLGYEFQFMRKWFDEWQEVFCISPRKPIYARTTGFEFRCSYLLTGYSLEKIGTMLTKYPVKKAVGQLDYDKPRHSETPLTDKELEYCVSDVLVVAAKIQELIDEETSILKIPYTKTGYVRRFCRDNCYDRKKPYDTQKFRRIIRGLKLNPDEYRQLKRAFQGGFTHANPFYVNKTVDDVTSFDFTSSYPSVMIAEKFPMSQAELIEQPCKEEFDISLNCYCCLFDITFENLQPKLLFDNYLSISRCRGVSGAVINNGRVVSAKALTTTLTEQDYFIMDAFYTWDNCYVGNLRRYKRDYLPTPFVKSILSLYQDKTKLKGVEGKEREYLNSKEMLNSCYGMAVTDIVRPQIIYEDNEWQESVEPDIEEEIKKYNKQKKRFLFYPWGVWVTAYARRNLFMGILEFGDDYIYSDTDSIKAVHAERHMEFIERYNKTVRESLLTACKRHKISPDLIEPETIKGVKKCLGVWDYDGHYKQFKTLGAKRYMVQTDNDKYSLTVSGLNKGVAVPYLLTLTNNPFEVFKDGLHVPKGFTGSNVHTYIDEPFETTLTDYYGKPLRVYEKSCIHLEPDEYTMGLSQDYIKYLLSIERLK